MLDSVSLKVDERKAGVRLASFVLEAIASMDLDPALMVGFVTDNASNGDTCFDELKKRLDDLLVAQGKPANNVWRQRCLSHILSLVVKELLNKKSFPNLMSLLEQLKALLKGRKNRQQKLILVCNSSFSWGALLLLLAGRLRDSFSSEELSLVLDDRSPLDFSPHTSVLAR